ncbi:MAG: sugar ABC transporter permease, partial [Rhodospirillales bacterium]|nr:sugar ABC transporter permease [Acetobacter sp.]
GGLHLKWNHFKNWTDLFHDANVGRFWLVALKYFVCTVGLEMVLGTLVALALSELARGREVLTSVLLMPMFIAPAIVGLLGRFMVDPVLGLYSYVLRALHLYNGNMLGDPKTAFTGLVLMDVWEWTPLVTIIMLAGLLSVPVDIIEAAEIDGAGYLARLRYIVLPYVARVMTVALLIRSMDAIRFFDSILVTTNGGPADTTKVVAIRLYETAFRFFRFGYAAAIGISMLAFSIVLANLFLAVMRKADAAAEA